VDEVLPDVDASAKSIAISIWRTSNVRSTTLRFYDNAIDRMFSKWYYEHMRPSVINSMVIFSIAIAISVLSAAIFFKSTISIIAGLTICALLMVK
jgi:hypothetical protein